MTRIFFRIGSKWQTLYPAGMSRFLFFPVLAAVLSLPRILHAQNDGPPISITSPDAATTFAYGTIKTHSLIWDKNHKVLIARVTFAEEDSNYGQTTDDTHEFRLPGVTFDEAKGIFFATSAKGEVIPVARIKRLSLSGPSKQHQTRLSASSIQEAIFRSFSKRSAPMIPPCIRWILIRF